MKTFALLGDVHVNNHTELTGGLVTSTDKAEVEGKNRFSTGTLNATDIQNQAETSGSAYKVSGSADINGGWTGDKKEALSAAIGYGEVDENQTATTKSGINTANIDIRDKQAQVAKTGQTAEDMLTQVKTEISTDTVTQNSGVLENHFDKDTVQKELDYQVKVTGEFQEITLPEIDRQMANKAAEYRKEEKILRQAGNEQAANEMAANAEKWEMGGEYKQRVDAIANAVGLALGGVGVEGTLAGAASPYINEAIKAQLPEDKNKAANVIAHVIWGAVEAKLQGASATTGALSTAVGELSAPIVSEVLYGTSNPNLLTEEQKQFVSDLSRIAATATGAISSRAEGNRSVQVAKDAVTSGKVAENAVENNLFGTVLNNPQINWQAVAEGEKIKRERDEEIRAYIKKEHPVIYQTAEGTYYFMSATGKAIYVAREMVIELAPMVIAPEIAAGTKVYAAVSRIALSGGANVVAQKVSGQEFNWAEFGGAIASGYISPHLKTTKDIVRVNAGIGMATGLANGSDGLSDAVLSGAAAYGATKTSNPLWSSVASEVIQKIPNIRDSIRNEEYKNEK
ncbi:VENN motif pre-toxin domain-containing protein [Basfia succiniciproducens]|uniref:VENN motif pre-toxin domain-containing protein n=1 Tax=Basfia succiniciproducens TaxID=653940 RepID=UPI0008B7C216|nr:VENN motif pre-toxin domain-containing protein [Basfia succiniciproducens]SEP88663.1 Pre-toxin domain with VENN motif-containing protein [Basfia succiniciproducens]